MRPAFADTVLDAQDTFRALMEAMARPGRVQRAAPLPEWPEGLHPAAAGILLTLADAQTLLWTDAGPGAREWLAFHTGARFTNDPAEADILLATATPPALALLRQGTDEAPQEGATLIVQVAALVPGSGWRLTGPGIETRHRIAVTGLPADFPLQWGRSQAAFPCGVDLILTNGTEMAALPRTTRIEEAG